MSILKDFNYHKPVSIKEALEALSASRRPLLLAGGTFVLNNLKKVKTGPTDVIGLRNVRELHGIRERAQDIAVGAMTCLSLVVESGVVARYAGALTDAASRVATTPLRHMATIGGNIASRFFWVDLPAVLIALDAKAEWTSAAGAKKVLSIEEFLSLKGESARGILRSLLLPKNNRFGCYFRHTRAMEVDIPLVAMAFTAQKQPHGFKDVRCVVNTTVTAPRRLVGLEALWEQKGSRGLACEEALECLREELKETKLDPYRQDCLCRDLETLISQAKDGMR